MTLVAAGEIGGARTATAAEEGEKKKLTAIQMLAGELLVGLNRRSGGFKEKILAKWKGGWKIAVWPFDREPIPVPRKLAQSWNEALLDAMVKGAPQRYTFVTRTNLETLIKEVEGMDLSGKIKNPVAAVAGKAKVDILIVGKMLTTAGGVNLSYQAVDMGGSIVATTGKELIRLDTGAVETGKSSLTMDAAIEAAATKVAMLGGNLERIRVSGIRYADSGIQTSFGRYVVERFTDELQNKMLDVLSGNSLKITDAKISDARLRGLRGVDVTPRSTDQILTGDEGGDYLLTGNYWDLGPFVRLRIVLRNTEGEGVSWSGRIHRASVPSGLNLVPQDREATEGDNHGYGPIGLDLSSNKGHNPVFRIGEKMTLLVRASENVFLNCFYRQVDGSTLKIFPNRYHTDARVQGRSLVHIPDEKMGFDFKVNPPLGSERVRCIGSDKDLSMALPPEIGKRDLEPIPRKLVLDLVRYYRSVPGARVSEVSMAITVQE